MDDNLTFSFTEKLLKRFHNNEINNKCSFLGEVCMVVTVNITIVVVMDRLCPTMYTMYRYRA